MSVHKKKNKKNPNCTEKCTAINCFCFEVSFNTHLAGIIVKMLVSTHRWKSTRLLNAITLSVAVSTIRTGRGRTLAPHSSPVVRLTPPEPSRSPCLLFYPSLSPSARCACSAKDLVTPLLTAAVRLSYQLHWVTDTLSNPDPSFYSPSGIVCHFFSHYTLHCYQHTPQILTQASTDGYTVWLFFFWLTG